MATPGTVSATTPQGLHSHLFGRSVWGSTTTNATITAISGNGTTITVTATNSFKETATITNVTASAGTVTYTAANAFVAGNVVTITGVNPDAYNLTNVTIASASSTQFTVTSDTTGTYISGGKVGQNVGIAGTTNYDGIYIIATRSSTQFTITSSKTGATSTGVATIVVPEGTFTSADAFFGNYASSDVTASLLYNLGPNAVAIGGRQFIVDTSADPYRRDSFKHKSIPAQRQSINLTNIAGEGTINTEGLWRRGQTDWTSGAGQKYLDRKTTSDDSRFYQSKGVDVFASPGQVTLQNATKSIKTSSNTNLKMSRCGSYTYVIDGNAVYECADITAATPTWTTMTFNGATGHVTPSTFYSIDSNGSFVFLATNTGIWYYRAGGTGGTVNRFECYAENDTGTQFTGYNMVRWCNDRVVAGSGIRLYCFETTHTTWPTAGNSPTDADKLMSMSNDLSWTWSDACPGPTAIYFTGYAQISGKGYNGGVFKSGITVTGLAIAVSAPTQALPMSPDEYPTCIQGYLDYIFIGTNRGIRMTQPDNQGGLTSGPYSPSITQPVTYPVRSITGDGRFVWFGWSNYDNSSTGLGRLNLANNIANQALTPAYQSDLMVTGQGEVLDASWDPALGQPLFAVSGKGFYTTDTTKYVAQGYIKSGGITYGIPDHKTPVFFDYGVDMPDNTPVGAIESFVSAELEVEPFDPSQKQTLAIPPASEGLSQVSISSGSAYKSEMFQVTVLINSDSTNVSTPILYRYTLQSYPATVSETQIVVPVQLHLVNVVDGLETYVDPYEAFMYFEELRQSNTIITYQESTLTANVVITLIDWQPHKRQGNYESGFEGNCVVYLQTVGGYNTYPGIPTN